ncbi:MAG: ArnT family glycosyltransferase [Candidatus Omnitrophota bacterium]
MEQTANRNTSSLNWLTSITILLIVIAVNVIRFIGLEQSPPGFHVDELSGAVTVQCLSQEGIDALDNPYPLFAGLNYGSPKPPTYIYPAVLWTRLFGYSIFSFRALSGFITVLSIIGLFFLSARLFSIHTAYWVILTASVSPFVFQVSRIALEACLAPCFIIWGIYFFVRSDKYINAVISGLLFSAAMYSYPPARLLIPLLILPLICLRWSSGQRNLYFIGTVLITLALVSVPLVSGTLNGEYAGRFNKIGIFSDDFLAKSGKSKTLVDLAGIFIGNYWKHLTPEFLFFSGDANYVYSTGQFGLLSWLDSAALLTGGIFLISYVIRKLKNQTVVSQGRECVIIFLITGIALSIVPSALTWQDIPHSLRIICIWPFLSLLTGYIIDHLSGKIHLARYPLIVLACVFIWIYGRHYFLVYPEQSYWMFNGNTKDEVLNAKSQKDWMKFVFRYRHQNFHLRYYLMNYLKGQNCPSSQKIWKEVHKMQ